MENYIVRIYRRDENDRGKVTGVIESVEQQTTQTFHTLNNLRSVLMQGLDDSSQQSPQSDRKAALEDKKHALLN